jgi:hypothetical protein
MGMTGTSSSYRTTIVLPDGPTARGAATSWRVYLVSQGQAIVVLPLVGNISLRTNGRTNADHYLRDKVYTPRSGSGSIEAWNGLIFL